MPPTKGNLALMATLDSVTRALGQGPTEALDPGLRGGGDISFIAAYTDGIDGLGVIGRGAHTPDETLDLKSVPRSTVRASVFINRLTHAPQKRKSAETK
jgi:glutamate carboxypeptidase